MMKRNLMTGLLATLFLQPALACEQAKATANPQFCSSFVKVAKCHCENHMPSFLCKNTEVVYELMVARYGSQEEACKWQEETTYQICMDDWNCYRLGGRDSKGNLCSSTGLACNSQT